MRLNDKFETFILILIIIIICLPFFIVGIILYKNKNNPNFGKTEYQIMCEEKGGYYLNASFSTPKCDFEVLNK